MLVGAPCLLCPRSVWAGTSLRSSSVCIGYKLIPHTWESKSHSCPACPLYKKQKTLHISTGPFYYCLIYLFPLRAKCWRMVFLIAVLSTFSPSVPCSVLSFHCLLSRSPVISILQNMVVKTQSLLLSPFKSIWHNWCLPSSLMLSLLCCFSPSHSPELSSPLLVTLSFADFSLLPKYWRSRIGLSLQPSSLSAHSR